MPPAESEEKVRWDTRYSESPASWTEPDEFLQRAHAEFLSKIPPGNALDVAGGAGRNALFLARRGWRVKLMDISEVGLGLARKKAEEIEGARLSATEGASLETVLVDLNTVSDLGVAVYNLITVFYFLRRELFPAVLGALRPGGFLIYRTYTVDRMKVPGGPDDAKYLLQPNELLRAFSSLRVLHYHETLEGKAAAELVACRNMD